MALLQKSRSKTLLGHYAGFATRLLAFAIDTILVAVIIVFVSWFTNTTISMLMGREIVNSLERSIPALEAFTAVVTSPITHSVVSVIFVIAYYLFFWTLIGQTPGKYLMGIRIVTIGGKSLRLRHSIIRYLGYYLSGLIFGLGFFWILFDDQRRGWHDRLSGTCVIYVWDALPDEKFLVHLSHELVHRRETLQNLLRRKKRPIEPEEPSNPPRIDSF